MTFLGLLALLLLGTATGVAMRTGDPPPPLPPAERVIVRESEMDLLRPEDLRREMNFQMNCPVNVDWCDLEIMYISERLSDRFGFEVGDRLLGHNGERAQSNLRYALDIIGYQMGLKGDDINVHVQRGLERIDITLRFQGPYSKTAP